MRFGVDLGGVGFVSGSSKVLAEFFKMLSLLVILLGLYFEGGNSLVDLGELFFKLG